MTDAQHPGTAGSRSGDGPPGTEMPYPDPHPADPADDLTTDEAGDDDGAQDASADGTVAGPPPEADSLRAAGRDAEVPDGTPTPVATPSEAPSDPHPQ